MHDFSFLKWGFWLLILCREYDPVNFLEVYKNGALNFQIGVYVLGACAVDSVWCLGENAHQTNLVSLWIKKKKKKEQLTDGYE